MLSQKSQRDNVIAYAPMSNSGNKRHPMKAIVAGGLAGGIEASISYPTEYVKTQLQLFDKNAHLRPVEVARQTMRRDGFFGFYRGLSSLLFFSVPKTATRFFSFEAYRGLLQNPDGTISAPKTFLAGLGAGFTEAIVAVTPMDTIKTKLIHDQLSNPPHQRKYRGFFHGVRTIVHEQGIRGTYMGITATLLKQGSNQAIRWLTYTKTREWLAGGPDTSKLHTGHTILASLLAGSASVYGNTPMDVIKTRMQGLQAHRYKNTWDCARQIYCHEGFRGFYKGATARLTRVCLDVTVVMVLYEEINKTLDRIWEL